MRILPILLLASVESTHDYFQYDDCGETCTSQRTCCTISKEAGGFDTRCCDSEFCMAQESNLVVCLRPGSPPIGGIDIWSEFKRSVHPPTATPLIATDCGIWQCLTAAGWTLFVLSTTITIIRFIMRKMRRTETDSEAIVGDDDSGRSVVHNIAYVEE